MQSLTPTERERLAKLLGMLGSDHEGERANAATIADRMLRERGLTWRDILPDQPAGPTQPPATKRAPRNWRADIELLAHATRLLTPWEEQFVASVRRQRRFSKKQAAIIARLAGRVRKTRGEGAT
jgi:hypothetical protein